MQRPKTAATRSTCEGRGARGALRMGGRQHATRIQEAISNYLGARLRRNSWLSLSRRAAAAFS
jgi:hypothetical protein